MEDYLPGRVAEYAIPKYATLCPGFITEGLPQLAKDIFLQFLQCKACRVILIKGT